MQAPSALLPIESVATIMPRKLSSVKCGGDSRIKKLGGPMVIFRYFEDVLL